MRGRNNNSKRKPKLKPMGQKDDKSKSKAKGKSKSMPKRPAKKMEVPIRDLNPRKAKPKVDDGLIRLNKYISNAGVCSRREADTLIKTGVISVNDKVVTELGTKVKEDDVIKVDGETISRETQRYVLLNKPKNFITTMDDPEGRKTVMHLIKKACKERIFPVGRLDRNTTGLLLFTNDGDLAKRLTHPKHGFRKIYHVELKEKVKPNHLNMIREGIELEDGFIKADEIDFVGDGQDMHQVGIEIHSGKNRIVRRIFEHFGYSVKKLDRVMFAGLTKKDIPRGEFRHLTKSEVGFLKMIR
ncbi:pseudouridine synthase [Halocola ammonii]